MITEFFRRLRYHFQCAEFERELNEEMEHHLAMKGAGDKKEFGNVTLLKERSREQWGWLWCEQLAQDLRYAFRAMAGNKAFTAMAVLSLALGIGANTAIYSFLDSILLRALPVKDPGSLAVLNWHAKKWTWGGFVLHAISGSDYEEPDGTISSGIFPYPAFELFEKNDAVFSSVFAYRPARGVNVNVSGQAYLVNGEYVSGSYFQGLDVPPAAGRLIIPDDDRVGGPAVVVVSYAFSQNHFGGPESAAGKTILINNLPFLVAGVTPPRFFGIDPGAAPEIYLPLHADLLVLSGSQYAPKPDEYLDRNYYWVEAMGRLRPGVNLVQAQAVLEPQFDRWVAGTASTDAERSNLPWLVMRTGAAGLDSLRRTYSKPLYVLLTLVALILAIACANVANLLLARTEARRREIALRLSIGAGRGRLVRQLLTESVLLASIGGTLGVLFAIWGKRFLTVLLANGDENFTLRAELNWRVLALAVALSFLTGVLFGLAPAFQSIKVDVIKAVKEPRAREIFRGQFSLGQVLVTGQVAMSLVMLVAAGLFVGTLRNLRSIDVGFDREGVLLFRLNARQAGRPPADVAGFYDALRKRFVTIPGVRDVTLSNQPLSFAGYGVGAVIPGKKSNPDDRMLMIGPWFFKTMRIPILAGREINDRDTPGSQPVAVVSEYFAKVNFPGENPLGKHVIFPARPTHPQPRDMEIVGIVRDVDYGGVRDKKRPVLYFAYNQGWPQPEQMYWELRTTGDPLAYVRTVRDIVHRADDRMPVTEVETQSGLIDRRMNQEIVFAELCSGFAALALVIACVGLYGTVSYNIARRTSEIGIRIALGAERRRVVCMILWQVIVITAAGLAIGVPAALGSSKLVASFLYGMKPNDPWAIVGAATILAIAATLAGYAPARRASRIDPMVALRNE